MVVFNRDSDTCSASGSDEKSVPVSAETVVALLGQSADLVSDANARLTASGELFNLFSITRIERDEVNTHSAMIAELLNPRGRHGQGECFLKLFLSTMGFEHQCPIAEAKVYKEQAFAGYGRVDIVIRLRDHLILIENKIDALDGKEQLWRYGEVGKASGKSWHLWYLTKKGTSALETSHCGVPYRRMSYQEHILDWLEQCINASSQTPALVHALIQYKNLVQKITGRTMTHITRNALVDLITQQDNLMAAEAIAQALPHAKGKVLHEFFMALEAALSTHCEPKPAPADFAGHDYSEAICSRWFMPKPLKLQNVGRFFDIGVTGVLLRIEVASEALHYGLVGFAQGKVVDNDVLSELMARSNGELVRRDWKAFKWHSHLCWDNVSSNMNCLSDPAALASRVLHTVAVIKSAIPCMPLSAGAPANDIHTPQPACENS